MKPITPSFEANSANPRYLQLYEHIRSMILHKEIETGEKLPSLRQLSRDLHISITTVSDAYNQLMVEGYITSQRGSGFYVSDLTFALGAETVSTANTDSPLPFDLEKELLHESAPMVYDLSCFDFNKWKKCAAKVLTDYAHLLTFESDPQGEPALRKEIARYIYQSRGVTCNADQIVIGAGTQQITMHLARILQHLSIQHVAVEEPGYLPVKKTFRDMGFAITPVEVNADGIEISRLPSNIRSAVYVSPSNQFPTGAVMPVGRRYELLDWAERNNSIIIEDDYDSELRYFGRPIPALQGLDTNGRVVYLGSFSATLFPAIKISYMVLTPELTSLFHKLKEGYTQTCSKTEQLTLALFMERGYYQTNIHKLRSLYAQKLQATKVALMHYGSDFVEIKSARSGLNIILEVSARSLEELCASARSLGIPAMPVSRYADIQTQGTTPNELVLYYHQIPLEEISSLMCALIETWRKL